MTHILHIDSSPRGERSISRTLTREFISERLFHFPCDNWLQLSLHQDIV
jgi:FMN-dependent NADH-azoreductase